jgi:glutaredoxin-like protein NrdH
MMAKTPVTIFTTGPGCHLCHVTKAHLKKRGVVFEEIRIDEQPEWADRLKTMGYMTAPVVLVGEDDVWEGYSSDSINEWARDLVRAAA